MIRDLILEEPDFKKKYNDFVDNAIRNDRQREQDVDYYFSLKEDIKKKKEELLTRAATRRSFLDMNDKYVFKYLGNASKINLKLTLI